MFTATCSFKREEDSPFSAQENMNLKEIYHSVLAGKETEPMLHAAAPNQDSKYFLDAYLPAHPDHFNPLPGIHSRKVDMYPYNSSRHPLDRRQLTFYSVRGSLPLPAAPFPVPKHEKPTLTREANMHACMHMYASDRNSLFIVPNHLDRPREFTRMATLSHTVIFHVGIRDLVVPPEPRINHPDADPTLWDDGSLPLCNIGETVDAEGSTTDADGRKWFVQESWMTRANAGRALHTSRMWDYERGIHIATTLQDGLVRFKEGRL